MKSTKYTLFKLIFIISFCLLFFPYTSLAADPKYTPTSELNDQLNDQLLINELEQTKSLLEYYQNETEYWKNVHENDSINVSNQYLIETKNNISYINQQITEINQTIVNIEYKIQIIYIAVIITLSITLFKSLISIKVRIKNYMQKKHEK